MTVEEVLAPSWIDRYNNDLPVAQKIAPRFNLPDGRFIEITNRRNDQSNADIIGRAGCIAVQGAADNRPGCLEWTYSSILWNSGKQPSTRAGGYAAENLTEQDMINIVNTIPMSRVYANEIGEGNPWGTDYDKPQYVWFCKALKAKHDAYNAANPGNPWPLLNYGMYGSFGNFNGDPWLFRTGGSPTTRPNSPSAPFINDIASVQNARNSCAYFGLLEQHGVGAVIKSYADQADYAADYYRKKFAAHVMGLGMGYVGGLRNSETKGHLAYLDWPNIEQLGGAGPGSLHNGLYYTRTKPNGQVVSHEDHPVVSYDWLVGCQFGVGMCLTDGCLPFNAPGPSSIDPASDSYPFEPLGMMDSYFETAYRYSRCERTEGRPWQYCKYTVQSTGQVITPKNDGTDILDHASAFGGPYADGNPRTGRADAMYRVNASGTAVDFWVFDPSRALNSVETLILEPIAGQTLSVDVRGGKLRQFRGTI